MDVDRPTCQTGNVTQFGFQVNTNNDVFTKINGHIFNICVDRLSVKDANEFRPAGIVPTS